MRFRMLPSARVTSSRRSSFLVPRARVDVRRRLVRLAVRMSRGRPESIASAPLGGQSAVRRNRSQCAGTTSTLTYSLKSDMCSRISGSAASPPRPRRQVTLNCTEHDVVLRLARGRKAGGDDDGLQLDAIDDQRLASHAEAACLVQKNESPSAGMLDVNDQGQFSTPSRGIAAWALRKAFANVRIEHE